MKTRIKNFNVDWLNIKDACMRTIGKEAGKEPNSTWKRKLLICQHSPIRRGTITWQWDDVPFYVMGHFVRHHVGCTPYVSTSREDRTGTPREERTQVDPVSMQMDANVQSLIDIAQRRLCLCSDKNTIAYMKDLREAVGEYDEDVQWSLAPQCVWANGCKEPFSNCKFYENFSKDMTREEMLDVETRLDKYNAYVKKLGGK